MNKKYTEPKLIIRTFAEELVEVTEGPSQILLNTQAWGGQNYTTGSQLQTTIDTNVVTAAEIMQFDAWGN